MQDLYKEFQERQFPIAKVVLGFIGLILVIIVWNLEPPRLYPVGTILEVPTGMGLYQLSQKLGSEHIVRSPFWFRNIAILLGGERRMKAGEYYLDSNQTAPALVWRIFSGDYRIEVVKVTIPEGYTNEKISKLFNDKFVVFDNEEFLRTANQGYLFPDTYFIPVTASASSTIKLMHDNFEAKVSSLNSDVVQSGKTLNQIISMASLLEAEANTAQDREIISGILWKRIKIGMPLQVDVEMKTYDFQGLPSIPINNPGLVSITAAIHPSSTPYLYYLTGHDGLMHYAKTFDEHKRNIQKYLSN